MEHELDCELESDKYILKRRVAIQTTRKYRHILSLISGMGYDIDNPEHTEEIIKLVEGE